MRTNSSIENKKHASAPTSTASGGKSTRPTPVASGEETEVARSQQENVLRFRPGYLVRRLQQVSVSIFSQEMAKFDLTPVQYGVLAVVVDQPNIDQVSSAELVGVDRTTIVGVIDRLARKGLVTRSVSPYDKRVRVLNATVNGAKLFRDVEKAAEAVRLRLLQPLSNAEAALFCEMMEKVIDYHHEQGDDQQFK